MIDLVITEGRRCQVKLVDYRRLEDNLRACGRRCLRALATIVLLGTLSLGTVLNGGFDQVFNLYNPLVYQTGDIIDTWVYRTGLLVQQYGLATAIGLLKGVVGFFLIIVSYRLAARYANYRVF